MKTSHIASTESDKGYRYIGLILLSTFLQGSSFVASQFALREVSPLWLASERFLIASLAMLPLIWVVKRRPFPSIPTGQQWLSIVAIGALQTSGVIGFLNFGLRETTAARAALLMASNPLVVIVFSSIFLGERFSGRSILGLLISFLGVVTSLGSGALLQHRGTGRGEALVACASLCWAASTILAKRIGAKLDAFDLTFWQMLSGSILLVGIACLSRQSFALPQTSACWYALLWLAIPASTGAMGTWFAALSLGGAVRTSGFLFLCPVFSALIAFFVEGQVVTPREVVGALLVGVGLLIVSRRSVQACQPHTRNPVSTPRSPTQRY